MSKTKAKNTICLWFNKDAQDAARFYAATFPNSEVTAIHKAPGDFPSGKEGEILTVERRLRYVFWLPFAGARPRCRLRMFGRDAGRAGCV
jgi:predicted 3-demethylubiquinone-9 3-methyltransferase (glyoxalase superfamily)